MPSTLRTATAAAALLSSIFQLSSATPVAEAEPSTIAMAAMTYVGCFKSATPMTDQGSYTYQTSGYCQPICYGLSDAAMALTGGSNCWCGSSLPAKDDLVDDSYCNTGCNGYDTEMCGGDDYWSVYKTGLDNSVSYYSGSAASSGVSSKSHASSTASSSSTTATSAASATTNTPVVITSEAPGKTVVITLSATNAASATSTSSSESKEHKSKSNTAGIAAGVVVGVVVIAAIAGGAFFYMRNRKRKQIEEEYSKRSQAQGPGMSGSRGMSVHASPGPDARLDPEAMINRRLSDGSIADEQDYSRRILKVTNPDDGR